MRLPPQPLKLSPTETAGSDGSEGSIEALIGSLCWKDPPFAKPELGTAKASVAITNAEDNRSMDVLHPRDLLLMTEAALVSAIRGAMHRSLIAHSPPEILSLVRRMLPERADRQPKKGTCHQPLEARQDDQHFCTIGVALAKSMSVPSSLVACFLFMPCTRRSGASACVNEKF